MKPRQRKPKQPPKPKKEPRPKLTDEERRQRQREYSRRYTEKKKREAEEKRKAALVAEPVPDDRKLAVVLGENVRSQIDSPRVVIQKYPLCNLYSVSVLQNGKLTVAYYSTEDAAFQAAKKYKLKRYRDISEAAFADYQAAYQKGGANNGTNTAGKNKQDET